MTQTPAVPQPNGTLTLSRFSAAALAARYNMDLFSCIRKITWFAETHLQNKVHDESYFRDYSISQYKIEFTKRLETKQNLPLLVSSCPGFVSYIKTSHPKLVPLLCPVMSSQQISDRFLTQNINVAPCHDKKLEGKTITTTELELLFKKANMEFQNFPELELHESFSDKEHCGLSGGYLEHVLQDHKETIINENYMEYKSNTLMARVYGFRNIQNFLKKYKKYHFVEVMACPRGCANGGGQGQISDLVDKVIECYSVTPKTTLATSNEKFHVVHEQVQKTSLDW